MRRAIVFGIFSNSVRKSVNLIDYSDEENLLIAQNRIANRKYYYNSWSYKLYCWFQRLFGQEIREEPFKVSGQELRALHTLAHMDEDQPIKIADEYAVNPSYYKKLTRRAVSNQKNSQKKFSWNSWNR